jgi:glucokinase
LGTGVAFGLVVDGLNVAIEESRQGHLELLVVDRSSQARKCPCGKRGCLETVASGRALQDQAGAADLGSDLAALGELEAGGHDGARKILTDAALALAKALENIQKECRPDVICLGGGVTEALPQLLPTIERHLSAFQRERTLGPLLRIEPARLGDTAGVVGAALLAKAGAITSN